MLKTVAIGLVCAWLALGTCSAWWEDDYDLRQPTCPDRITIFTSRPTGNYIQLGTVSSPGGPNTIPAENYRRLQKAAARLGAYAVILTDQIPPDEPNFWQYPHTGIAIVYPISQL